MDQDATKKKNPTAIRFLFQNIDEAAAAIEAFWRRRYGEERYEGEVNDYFGTRAGGRAWLEELTHAGNRTRANGSASSGTEVLIISYGWFRPLTEEAMAAIRDIESLGSRLGTENAQEIFR